MDYKKELLEKLSELRKEAESSKDYFGQVAQDYTEEYYSSDDYGCYWEASNARYNVGIAEMFLLLLSDMVDKFDKLA